MSSRRVQQRYRLGMGGVVYLLVMVMIGAAAVNSQTNLLFWVFGLMFGGLLVSVWVSGSMLWGLRVRRLLPDHGAVDEPLLLRYELTNRRRLLPCFGVVITEVDGAVDGALRGVPHGWVLHVGPNATVQAETTGWPARRARVNLRRIGVESTFPFGIFRRRLVFDQPGHVVIYPKLLRLRRELLRAVRASDPAGPRPSPLDGGSDEFFGLREYRHGDGMKTIDWKHSARLGELVSRELTRQKPPRLMILLDLRRKGPAPHISAERAISFAASVVCEAHLEGFEVGLRVAGAACAVFDPRHGRWHRARILHALGELDLTRGGAAAEGAAPPRSRVRRDGSWMVIHAGAVDRGYGPPGAAHFSDAELEGWTASGTAPAEGEPEPSAPAGAARPAGAAA